MDIIIAILFLVIAIAMILFIRKKIRKYKKESALVRSRKKIVYEVIPKELTENLLVEFHNECEKENIKINKTHEKLAIAFTEWYYLYNYILGIILELKIEDMPCLHFEPEKAKEPNSVLLTINGIPTSFSSVPDLGILECFELETRRFIGDNKKRIIKANRKIWENKAPNSDNKIRNIHIPKHLSDLKYDIDAEAIILLSMGVMDDAIEKIPLDGIEYKMYLKDRMHELQDWWKKRFETILDEINSSSRPNYYLGGLLACFPAFYLSKK